MKRRSAPTPAQVTAALAMYATAAPDRIARAWRIHWQNIEPTVRTYQWPVSLDRVLGEHHGAVAAEPMEHCPACTAVEPKR